MTTEDYVSFNTAKLLKEKGFGELCHGYFRKDNPNDLVELTQAANWNDEPFFTSRPTLQMAMKWLREKCIFITLNIISFNFNDSPIWSFDIWHNNNHEYRSSDYFDSYEQTCESAIKYCLENLI